MHAFRTRFARFFAPMLLVALLVNALSPLAGISTAYASAPDPTGSDEAVYICTQAGIVAVYGPIGSIPEPEQSASEHCSLCVLGAAVLLTPSPPTFSAMAPSGPQQVYSALSIGHRVSSYVHKANPSRAPPVFL